MTEAKQKSNESQTETNNVAKEKKGGLIPRFFKWAGKGILALLLITAIYFQAPWKITTLLAIILAVCILLPKPVRKGFWLAFAILCIVVIIWIILPEHDPYPWCPYTFDEELAALEAKYAVPDEDNAALIYDSLLEDYDDKTMHPEFMDSDLERLTYSEQWTSQDYPELAEWIKQHQDIIQTLFRAVEKEKCKFPINVQLEVTDKMEIHRLSAVRSWALLLLRAANNDMAEERTDQALEKYTCALKIANHLCQQQEKLDFMVGFQLEKLALTQLNRFLIEGEPTAEQLRSISDATDNNLRNNWRSDFSIWLATDALFWKNAFGHFYEVNPDGKIRFSRNSPHLIGNLFFRKRLGRFFRDKKANKIYAIPAWFFLPSTPQKAAFQVKIVMVKYGPMTQPDFNWNQEPNEPELSFELNYWYMVKSVIIKENNTDLLYHNYHDLYLEQITLHRGLRLLVAIRQYKNEHGSWPPDLDSIKITTLEEAFLDPVSGKPLQYENHGERFSLYGEKTNVWPR